MALATIKKFLIKRKFPKKLAQPFIIILYFSVIFTILFWIIPNLISQMMALSDQLPEIKKQLLSFPYANVLVTNVHELVTDSPDLAANAKGMLGTLGKQTLGGIFSFGIFIVVSLYMFIDGSRSYRWCRSHFSSGLQQRMDKTVDEIEPIITAYVFGQATTSTLAAIVVYISALLLKIPAALTLAVLAAFFDILPGIGFILIAVTSTFLGLAVSAEVSFTILGILAVYYLFESYVLTPYIYGSRMKLSPLVVLMSLIFAGTVAGVPAMIAILPIVAAYEPIERLWFKRQIV